MDRSSSKYRMRGASILLACCLAILSSAAAGAGIEASGETRTTLDKAANGVAVVNIANPNKRGLSHNKYQRFNVDKSGLILNNSDRAFVDTRLGGKIFGNARLQAPASVIINEVTSTRRSALEGYTEVAGQRADIVIANPNGISINGAGFINSSRVTLTTGIPGIDARGDLAGFAVRGGDITIDGLGLDTRAQDATSIYSHYLQLNASLHARDLDIALGVNQIDYPGRKISRSGAGPGQRILLDSSALGGMYAHKIVLVGSERGLGMNLPARVIAATGDIKISADGRLQLQQLDAGGDIRVQSAAAIDSNASVYAAGQVEMQSAERIAIHSGLIAARGKLSLAAEQIDNHSSLLAGLDADGVMNDRGELAIQSQQLVNSGALTATSRIDIDTGELLNRGLINADNYLQVNAASLVNEATLFSGWNTQLQVRSSLLNSTDAVIFTVNDLLLAADNEQGKSAQITNQLGLIQSLQGNIDVFARRFDNLGTSELGYEKIYYDLGNGREVSQPGDAMTIDLAYSSGYTKHNATARDRWIREVLRRLNSQAPLLYAANAPNIRNERSALFDAIETRLVDHSTTTPAYLDSGKDLTLHVDEFNNHDSVTSAAGDIHFDVSGDYRNQASSITETVTDYQYYTYADHDSNWKNDDKYSSIGRSGYIDKQRSKRVSANTVTQAGGAIDGEIGGQLANAGVLQGQYQSSAALDPASFTRSGIVLPQNDFGLFVRTSDPQSRYLVETNPRFTDFGSFIGSDYLLERLDYAPQQSLKLIGDAFYESKLIRDSVFAQTGRRFLDDAILSDNQQYQYLMDNALLARKSLQLAPGVALDSDQVNRLTHDIVWLVKQRIEGEEVLVPTVYLATGSGSAVRGGKIIAGSDTRLQVATLVNSGLLETGANLAVDAEHEIENRGLLRAQGDLRLTANGDINNLSGRIEARNINLTSRGGDINHRREREDFAFAGNEVSYSGSLLGAAAVIQASAAVELEAAGNIEVDGSMVAGRDVQLDAAAITISAADAAENFSAGDRRDHFKESAVTHFASMVNGQDIVILSTGETGVMGSQLNASASLQVTAGAIAIDALSDSESRARKDTEAGNFSKTVSSQRSFRSHSIGSEVNAATVVLITGQGDIELRGSAINASSRLTMNSAGDIRIEAARETAFEESHERKSGWFSGGSIYAESEDLHGRMGDIAVNGQIDAGSVTLDAVGDIEMVGVDIEVHGNLTANGRDITLRHATSEETEYSKHTEIRIGATDLVSAMASIDELATLEDGRLKLKLTDAQFDDMESVTRRSSVVASQVQAGALQFNAGSDASGDIVIEGSDIQVENSLELTAVGDVALLDAHNVSASDTRSRSGTAEVYLTAQNEYEQALRAIEDVRDAERDLRHARRDYEQYQKELDAQKDELERLQQDLAAGAGFVEPADVDEFERRLKRLQDDEDFYRTNILFATATLASQTTALVEQTARAAASSATYGFNASLELDVDALERELEEYYRQSRASSLSATNIAINAADTALLRGVNLQAREDIDIEAAELEILAGVNTGAHSERSRHAEFSYRWDLLGSSSTLEPSSLGGSIGADISRSNTDSEQQVNTQLQAANIRLTANGDTVIRGAEIEATEKLEITTGNLEVASVQDYEFSDSRTQGLAYSGEGAGLHESSGEGESIRTRVTRLSGQQVDIEVADHTDLRGAIIAAVDAEGRDNGQLSLTTNTLAASSLNNTNDSKNSSGGLNIGATSSLDYQGDNLSTKTRSLATLGSGDLQVNDRDGSDIRYLNTDITATGVAIHDIESRQGLSGELDIRLLSESGRDEIVEDWMKSEMIGHAIGMIATNKTVGLTDYFAETGKLNDTYDALKGAVVNSPELADFLQNPAITDAQKEQMMDQLTAAVMLKLGYNPYQNQVIATDETGRDGLEVRGFYSTEVGQAFINDRHIASIDELVTTAGHEATRAMDHQAGVDFDSDRQDRTDYAENYGSLFSAYTDHALEMAGYDAGVSQGNLHVGNDSQSVTDNNAVFGGLDTSRGDNFLQHEDKLRYVLLTDALDDCRTSGSCSNAQRESMLAVAVRLLKEDKQSDQMLANACRSSSSSPACRAEVKKLKAAFDSYKDLPVGEQTTGNTWSEYIDVGYLYGTYRSEAYSENAMRATETMTREAVSAAGELTLIAVKASAGNEAAQHQLAVIAENIRALVKDPAGTVEQGIKSRLDEADRYEAQGDINKAEEIRSQLFLEGAFAVAGLSTGAVSVIRHGVDLTDFKTKTDVDRIKTSDDPLKFGVDAEAGVSVNQSIKPSTALTPIVLSDMPNVLGHQGSNGITIVNYPNKTTTILGSYVKDIAKIIDELEYPKTLDFEDKKGGFNLLNAPDSLNESSEQFWQQYNKPFLDKAIQRDDEFILVTSPTNNTLNRTLPDGSIVRSGFGREFDYLKSRGYRYDASVNKMTKD